MRRFTVVWADNPIHGLKVPNVGARKAIHKVNTNMKASVKLPQRVFNSPLIKFANFEAASRFINLIRLTKPYANGDAYAISEGMEDGLMFKTLEQAERKFDSMVESMKQYYKMTSGGKTANYSTDAEKHSQAGVSPAPKPFLGKTNYQYAITQTKVGTFYCASPRFGGTTCYAAIKGGNIVAKFLNEADMLGGSNSIEHWITNKPIDSLGCLVDEMEDESSILTPPFKEFS
jgi:hypothetical protein